jgi:chromosome segregation ATPase
MATLESEFAKLKKKGEYLTYSLDLDINDNCELIEGLMNRLATLETELTKEKSGSAKLTEKITELTERLRDLEVNSVQVNEVDLLYNMRVKVGYS